MARNPDARYGELFEKFRSFGQEHVFRFWDELSVEQREAFLEQLATVDLPLIDRLARQFVLAPATEAEADGELSPPEVIAVPRDENGRKQAAEAMDRGESLIRAGKVGLIQVAGGQGTRLGYKGPKGKFPVTPIKKKSLFQLHAEKIGALSRRYEVALPWYIMTSETNDAETRKYFAEKEHFGLDPRNVRFFCQEMLPSLDRRGKLILDKKHHLSTSPNGHGGTLQALRNSGCLADMEERGIEELCYFQVDNVLNKICDPIYIGYHTQAKADMSCKVVAKKDAYEKVGVVGFIGDQMTVIEYSDLPEDLMQARDQAGNLLYSAGSIATHMINRAFIEKLTDGSFVLPYHVAHKRIPYLDERAVLIEPQEPNGHKFEMFIFDALQFADNPVVMEVERTAEFSPVKNSSGDASVETATQSMCDLFGAWFEAAGIAIKREPDSQRVTAIIEVSPYYALDKEEFMARTKESFVVEEEIYLS